MSSKDKKTRGGHRLHVRRVIGEAYELMSFYDSSKIEHVNKLEHYETTLKGKANVILELDHIILDKIDEEEIESEIEDSSKFMDELNLCLIELSKFTNSSSSQPEVNVIQSNGHTSENSLSSKVKLPKLELTTFDGTFINWLPFWENFQSLIDSNEGLSEVDKFSYLKTALKGVASSTISGLSLTSGNYKIAVELLQERFGDTQKIVSGHMDTLVNLPAVTHIKDLKTLRQFCDNLESNVRALAVLGREADQYGELLIPLLLNKLPREIRLRICSKVPRESWSLPAIIIELKRDISNRERCEYLAVSVQSQSNTEYISEPTNKGSPVKGRATASALVTNSEQPKGPLCVYCNQPHASTQCSLVTNCSKRKDILKREGRCFICVRKYHISKNCRSKTSCRNCQGRHHTSICSNGGGNSRAGETNVNKLLNVETTESKKTTLGGGETSAAVVTFVGARSTVLLQTAKAVVYRPDQPHRKMTVRLILDGGSQRSYVTEKVKKELRLLPSHTEFLTIKPFGSSSGRSQSWEVLNISLGLEGERDITISAICVPLVSSPIQNQFLQDTPKKYPHLSSLNLADDCNGDAQIDILIGADQYWNIVTGGTIRHESGPTAIHTKLGWVLSGPINEMPTKTADSVNLTSTHVLKCQATNPISHGSWDPQLEKFWNLESLGIQTDERSVYEEFDQKISYDGFKYTVGLPWKEPHPILPDNYGLSKKRLMSLFTRLKSEPEVLKEYHSVISEQIERGIVERVFEDTSGELGDVHYLPHHPVIRRDKHTTKVRVVYDASSKGPGGLSLNDCLYAGPSLNENIADILLKFRSYKTAVVGDIEKAFLMVSVAEDDRDVLRFLWVDDPFREDPEIIVLRFTRVVFGLSSSPFLLNATVKHHVSKYNDEDPEFVQQLSQSMYVDDIISGADDDDAAYEFYVKTKARLAEGGFNVRQFKSNSRAVIERINDNENLIEQNCPGQGMSRNSHVIEEDETYASSTTGQTDSYQACEKVLGIPWNQDNDQFEIDISSVFSNTNVIRPTKRDVVKTISRVYDPLGFVTPITIRLKMFFKKLWKKNSSWDEPLDDEMKTEWFTMLNKLTEACPVKVQRCYFAGITGNILDMTIHGFCDASVEAYAAVVYLKIKTTDGVFLRFVMSKTRVSPLKIQTIPRLELLSALILARLVVHVRDSLKGLGTIRTVLCWTDSTVVLSWIHGVHREWKQFVQNRVIEIRQLVPPESWNHCRSEENAADIASRGVSPELFPDQSWFCGPDWLKTNQEASKVISCEETLPSECLNEMRVKDRKECLSEESTLLTTSNEEKLDKVIDCKRHSRLSKLLRITALVCKFINILKARVTDKAKISVEISTDDINEAENLWIKNIQAGLLSTHQFGNWEREFGIYRDHEGNYRCGGRLKNADLTRSEKNPILLDKEHYVTALIVRHCHERVHHNGIKETLTEIRSKFWIIRGRQFVRKILYKCVVCRRLQGRPYAPPNAPALPGSRLSVDYPFTFIGVDFAGPLYLKHEENAKAYIALYTCGVSRAIHLDLVPSLSADAFLRSFQRFTARRGVPKEVRSDNAKTFKSASKSLSALFNLPEVRDHLLTHRVRWKFNLEKSPWWGGFFERLVQSVKRCLKKTLGKAQLTYEELLTVLVDIEATLNSRPLSFVSTEDSEEPLTPSHLMHGRRLLSLPDSGDEPSLNEVNAQELERRVDHIRTLMNHFWKRWRGEYLLELRNSHRIKSKTLGIKPISIGDVVIVHDDSKKRGDWKLGRVERLIDGTDGAVRGAVVITTTKGGKTTKIKRPVQRLYPIEMSQRVEDGTQEAAPVRPAAEPPAANDGVLRPRRAAAQRADEQRRKLIDLQRV